MGNDPTVGRSGLGGLPGPDRSFRNGRSILIRANTRVGKGALLRAVPTRTQQRLRPRGHGARNQARTKSVNRLSRAFAHPTNSALSVTA